VEANDGRLSISSRKDEGTLVEILLPARAARRA
jgi:signal transduction histidine kinase